MTSGCDTPAGEAPSVPAAFINAIAEEGTKAEAVHWLQKTWNELCAAESENRKLRADLERAMHNHAADLTAMLSETAARPIPGLPFADLKSVVEKPRRWADQYDFDKSDPATRLFVAASNWVDRCERAEDELARVKVERGQLALKLAGAECFIDEQRKKGNIK